MSCSMSFLKTDNKHGDMLDMFVTKFTFQPLMNRLKSSSVDNAAHADAIDENVPTQCRNVEALRTNQDCSNCRSNQGTDQDVINIIAI